MKSIIINRHFFTHFSGKDFSMLIDTHCHLNMIVKENFDVPLQPADIERAAEVIEQAQSRDVSYLINVGTSLIESQNCVQLAHTFSSCYAAIGIHPNDCTPTWHADLTHMQQLWFAHQESPLQHKIVGMGECGLDMYRPGYNLQRQIDAFKAQIELALSYELPLIVHTRQAPQETATILEEYKKQGIHGIIHCFSEQQDFAFHMIEMGFVLGIGGIITYPKNEYLRSIIKTISLDKIVLETDAPFLPPQHMRGKKNHPAEIKTIAEFIAQVRQEPYETIAQTTTATVQKLFKLN